MTMRRSLLIPGVILGFSLLAPPAIAAEKKGKDEGPRETVAKPLSEKERKRREEKLRKELEGPYRKWLGEDVLYSNLFKHQAIADCLLVKNPNSAIRPNGRLQ